MKNIRRLICVMLVVCALNTIFIPSASAAVSVTISSVTGTKFIKSDGTNLIQESTARITNNSGSSFTAYAKVYVGTEAPYIYPAGITIPAGSNQSVTVYIPSTHDLLNPKEVTNMRFELYDTPACDGDLCGFWETNSWKRTKHWEFYLSQEMHIDIGYTNYQESLRELFSGFMDSAYRYTVESEANPAHNSVKFRYSLQSGWMLTHSYMMRRNIEQTENLIDLIKDDKMELGATLFQHTTETFSAEEAARATYNTGRHLVDMFDIEVPTVQRMFDNPSFSKGYIDFAARSGIKYGIHSMNTDHSPYNQQKQYDLFYMTGFDPNNKMLIFNARHYAENYSFGGTHSGGTASVTNARNALTTLIDTLEGLTGRREIIYDKYPLPLVPTGDNKAPMQSQTDIANGVNEYWRGQGYVYPIIHASTLERYFEEVEEEFGDYLPVETGTEENWWNDGWGTTAYESGINKDAGSLIPVAETAASFASAFGGAKYPYDDIYNAYDRNLTYDEHTWGYSSYGDTAEYHNQFEWKRTNAFAARELGKKVLSESLSTLSKQVKTTGKAIYVYNPLNWKRDDIVTADLDGLPEFFEILDGGKQVPYTIEKGTLKFIAEDVPPLGYKTFIVNDIAARPSFGTPADIKYGADYIENAYYKVTFASDGTISSILDKQNGNREMVDSASPVKFNQYNYHYNRAATPTVPGEAPIGVTTSAIGATASLITSADRTHGIRQSVTLYNDMPRIDILNEVVKGAMPSISSSIKEEAFYTFPFLTQGAHEIRYDLPIGNVAEGEQVYGTSHAWYSANKWVNVKDKADDYNMTLAIPNTCLMQFGRRITGTGTQWYLFDYMSAKPYLFSYVMNNIWQTNFQAEQPGYVTFRYSIASGYDAAVSDKITRFGWEISTPLQATVIEDAQPTATRGQSERYLEIDKDNVQLLTMKAAEANSDGIILRFHEVTGIATGQITVTLPFVFDSVTETDIVENDLSQAAGAGNSFKFDLGAYGVKTFRVRFGSALPAVTGVKVESTMNGVPVNLTLQSSTVTASSVYDANYPAENAKAFSYGGEWASRGERYPTIEFTWATPIVAETILVGERTSTAEKVNSVRIVFNEGLADQSEVTVTMPSSKNDIARVVLASPKTITKLKAYLTCQSANNNGLRGLEVYAPGSAPVDTIQGSRVSWSAAPGALYYEVFRGTSPNFTPGKGNYLASTEDTVWFDTQVVGGLQKTYYYIVRACTASTKGAPSQATPQANIGAVITDTTPPPAPILGAQSRLSNRIDLFWTPVKDDVMILRYDVYRNGVYLGGINNNYVTTYRDKTAVLGVEYTYHVVAIDTSNNATSSNTVTISSLSPLGITLTDLEVDLGTISPAFTGNTSSFSLNLGNINNFLRYEGVRVTPYADDGISITVNGEPVASGAPSQLIPVVRPGQIINVKIEKEGDVRAYKLTATTNDPVISAINAITGSYYSGEQIPTHIIDDSGFTGGNILATATHDAQGSAQTMWHTGNNPGANAWIIVDLGRAYSIDELWIWNMNQSGNNNRGLKNVRIEYSTDPSSFSGAFNSWSRLAPTPGMTFVGTPSPTADYPFQFTQGTGTAGLRATNLNDGSRTPVDFGDNQVRCVKFTAHPTAGTGSWGGTYFGLSKVRLTRTMPLLDKALPPQVIFSVSGETITQLAEASGKTLDADVYINSDKNDNLNLIVALYDGAGKLVSFKMMEKPVVEKQFTSARISLDIPSYAGDMTYKLFVWDKDMVPISAATELK